MIGCSCLTDYLTHYQMIIVVAQQSQNILRVILYEKAVINLQKHTITPPNIPGQRLQNRRLWVQVLVPLPN